MNDAKASSCWNAIGAALIAFGVFAVGLAAFTYTAYFSVTSWMGSGGLPSSWRLPAFIVGLIAMPAFAFGAPLLRGRLAFSGPEWLARGVDVAAYLMAIFGVLTAFLFAGANLAGNDVATVIAFVVFLVSLARAVKG
jgi:hypothetical protein